jgi:hypothetical protein
MLKGPTTLSIIDEGFSNNKIQVRMYVHTSI